jgi:hypothetical protein
MPVLVKSLPKLIKIDFVFYQLSERILFGTIGIENKSNSFYELDHNHFK